MGQCMSMGSFWQCLTYSFSSNAVVGVAREEEVEEIDEKY